MEQVATVEPAITDIKLDKWKLFDLVGYKCHHPEVKNFHNAEVDDPAVRVKVCTGPRRSTKSYSSSHDVFDQCLLPGKRIWIVGPNYSLAEKEFRYIHEALVLRRNAIGLPKPKVCLTNPRSGQLYIEWRHGTIVEGKSADNPQALLGEAVDRVIYSEAAQIKREIRERYVQPTTVTRRGIEIIPTTPDSAGEWVLELFEKGNDPYFPDINSFSWSVKANPIYNMDEYYRAMKFYGKHSPVFREQYLGEWVFYTGRVYYNFTEENNVIEPFDIPKSWPVIRSIDFGHRDPFVCLWGAVGPTGEIYIVKEYYNKEGPGIPEHANEIKRMSAGMSIQRSVGDPEARQSMHDLSLAGIPCSIADNNRQAGRMQVVDYIGQSENNSPPYPIRDLPIALSKKAWPKLYVFNTCKELIREAKYYRWKESKRYESDKERTEGDDHAMDAMRYLIMTRPSPEKVHKNVPFMSFAGQIKHNKSRGMGAGYAGRF